MLATLVLNCTPVCKQNSLTWLCHCDCSLNQRSGVRIQSSETSEFMNQAKVAFTPQRITRRKMVVFLMKKIFFINQIAKSTAYYAA